MSELVGVCVYCNAPAHHTCNLCGALVCDKHYDPRAGSCTVCKQGKKVD